MWKGNDKIDELYLDFVKKIVHIYICIFMMLKQGEEDCGFGVVNVIHFRTVHSMCQNIGKIAHWWNMRSCVLYQIIWSK